MVIADNSALKEETSLAPATTNLSRMGGRTKSNQLIIPS